MDFEIYWTFQLALSALKSLARPIDNNVGDLFGRFVDNDLPNLEGTTSQSDVKNLEQGETAASPFVLLNSNLTISGQAPNRSCYFSSFIRRDIARVLGTNDD